MDWQRSADFMGIIHPHFYLNRGGILRNPPSSDMIEKQDDPRRFLSVFSEYGHLGGFVLSRQIFGEETVLIWKWIGNFLLAGGGLFAGMFVGCLALAIAEMLDSIPILTRRVSFRHGIGLAMP